jgi:ribosome-binding factor A
MDHSKQREEHIAHLAAQFLNRESNRTSLITVTRASINDKATVCAIFVSILPVSEEANAEIFLKRMAGPLKQYIQHEGGMQRVPHIAFVIDAGEKNRARIEELSQSIKAQQAPIKKAAKKKSVRTAPKRKK